MNEPMQKRVKFAHSLVAKILSGEKTATWRLFDDKNLSTGDELLFIDKETGDEFATAIIIGVKEKTFGSLNDLDWDGHEKFNSDEEMYRTYRTYYDEPVDSKTVVKLIDFSLLDTHVSK